MLLCCSTSGPTLIGSSSSLEEGPGFTASHVLLNKQTNKNKTKTKIKPLPLYLFYILNFYLKLLDQRFNLANKGCENLVKSLPHHLIPSRPGPNLSRFILCHQVLSTFYSLNNEVVPITCSALSQPPRLGTGSFLGLECPCLMVLLGLITTPQCPAGKESPAGDKIQKFP